MTADAPEPDRTDTGWQESLARMPQPAASAYPMMWPEAPAVPGPPQPVGQRRRRTLGVATAAATLLTLLGAPLGLLWLLVSPEVPVMKIRDEIPDWPGWRRGSIPVQPQPEGYIAADGWFSLLGLGFGILAAAAVWWVLRRQRGTVGLVAVVLGSLGAACLAAWLGSEIALAEYHRARDAVAVGELFQMPPQLRSGEIKWVGPLPMLRGVLLLPAFGAAVAYTLLAGWSRYPTLRPEPPALPGWAPAVPSFSWDQAAPQTPTAPPAPPATGGAAPPHG